MKISIIAAMGKNRVIGKDNQLMWSLPQELQYFKKTTMGHHLIMGRKTFESYPKVLPGRVSIVVTSNPQLKLPLEIIRAASIEDALSLAQYEGEEEVFIIGGANVYAQTIDQADRLYLTVVDFEEEGDAYFPEFDEAAFQEVSQTHVAKDDKNPYAWTAFVFDRKK